MKKNTTKRFFAFSGFILSFCLTSLISSAQVVTGNMNPSSFSSSVSQAIYDLDNNGQFDFKVQVEFISAANSYYALKFIGLAGTKFETDGGNELIGYNAGTPLGVNTYKDSGYVKSLYFPEGTFKFVGFTFKINGVSRCGYVQLRSTSFYQGFFDLWTFGYETNPSECITANESQASVGSNILENVKITPNPSNGKFSINLGDENNFTKISVTDIQGKIIQSFEKINSPLFELTINGANGIYFLRFETAEYSETIQLIKE
jgi:hypothetical protein